MFFCFQIYEMWVFKTSWAPTFCLDSILREGLLYPYRINRILSLSHVYILFSPKGANAWAELRGFVPAICSTLATTLVRQEAALIKLFVFRRGFLGWLCSPLTLTRSSWTSDNSSGCFVPRRHNAFLMGTENQHTFNWWSQSFCCSFHYTSVPERA